MYAKKIRMKPGCTNPTLQEISEIYVDGCKNPNFFNKEILHNYLKKNPDSIRVFIAPYPALVPAVSVNGEKYVKSTPNSFRVDNLLSLPRV